MGGWHTTTPPTRTGERGFTVSELVLVVVFVTGLLIAISVSVGNIRKETATTNCQSDLRTLKLATEQYRSENDAYPFDKAVLIDGGLVEADEVLRWAVEFDATDTEPSYRALDSSCR